MDSSASFAHLPIAEEILPDFPPPRLRSKARSPDLEDNDMEEE